MPKQIALLGSPAFGNTCARIRIGIPIPIRIPMSVGPSPFYMYVVCLFFFTPLNFLAAFLLLVMAIFLPFGPLKLSM